MKLTLLPERCIACGLCQTYSEIFDYDERGIVLLAGSKQLETECQDTDTAILEAVSHCPTRALLAVKSSTQSLTFDKKD